MGCVATNLPCLFLPGKLEALSLFTEALAILFWVARACYRSDWLLTESYICSFCFLCCSLRPKVEGCYLCLPKQKSAWTGGKRHSQTSRKGHKEASKVMWPDWRHPISVSQHLFLLSIVSPEVFLQTICRWTLTSSLLLAEVGMKWLLWPAVVWICSLLLCFDGGRTAFNLTCNVRFFWQSMLCYSPLLKLFL